MTRLKNWLPAFVMMALIFGLSSISSNEMPRFGSFDFSIKKFGHSFGYGLLAVSYHRGMNYKRPWLAWLMALLFAASDEFHQSFTPGRNPSVWDVLFYDNLGAALGLWLHHLIRKRKNS